MVDLPEIPRRIATTEAPSSMVTASDIVAPFANYGRALDKLGGAVEEMAVDAAAAAGKSAVTEDAEGNLSVQTVPAIHGKAYEAFTRSAQMTYLTKLEPRIKSEVLAKRMEFDGQPQKFAEWADGYTAELAGKQPSIDLENSVRQLAERHTSATYQSLAIARHAIDVASHRTALKEHLDQLDNDLANLARQGGTESEAYRGRLADYLERQKQAQTDPTLQYDARKAQTDLSNMATRHEVWGIIGAVRRTAEDKTSDDQGAPNGGVAKAKELADTILTSSTINLDQDTREKYYRVAISEIKQLQAENKVLVSQLTAESQSIVKSVREGNVDNALTRDFMDRAAEAGAVKAMAAVAREVNAQSWYRDWFTKLPVEDRANLVTEMNGKKPGGSLVDRIEGVESNGNPAAQASTSSALGSGQFTKGTWLRVLKDARPDIASGKTDDELLALRTDRALSREMIGAYAKENATFLTQRGLPATDQNLYLAHFLGAGDAAKVLASDPNSSVVGLINERSIAANQKIFEKNPTAGTIIAWAGRKMGQPPTLPDAIRNADNQTKLSFLSTAQRGLKADLNDRFATIEKTINAGVTPSEDDMAAFGAMVHAVGDDAQRARAVELGAKALFGAAYQNATPAEREQMKSQLAERYAAGGAKFTGELSDFATTINQRVTQAYQTDPYGASVQYGQRPALPSAAPDQAATLVPSLTQRVNEQSLIRDQQGMAPFTVLRPAEADAWKGTLTRGDVQSGAQFLGAVGQLAPDVSMATLTSKPIAEGITGMIFSRDPARMEVGMTALDKVWRLNPQAAEAAYGAKIIDRLQIWQGLRDSFNATEIAQTLNFSGDPAETQAREDRKTLAEAEVNKITPADVTGMFASNWAVFRPIVGGTANVPVQSQIAGQLAEEFKITYRALRVAGVEPEKATEGAVKRLGEIWGPSPSNGNQVMKYPPEKFYPSIGGSHAWIGTEIAKAIESYLGPRPEQNQTFSNDGLLIGGKDPVPARGWKLLSLVPDNQNSARVASGKSPAYTIVIVKPNGMLETVLDNNGRSKIAFDLTPYLDAHIETLRTKERQTKWLERQRVEQPGTFANMLGN